ncbi:MAG: hypothetical protein AAF732_05860 [Pseudomonadota bacterium]
MAQINSRAGRCHSPPARPIASQASRPRDTIIAALRNKISVIERRHGALPSSPSAEASRRPASAHAWTTGADTIDAAIGPFGLEVGAVHEVKPDVADQTLAAAACASARAFALTLAGRRLRSQNRKPPAAETGVFQPDILICGLAASDAELGHWYGPGLLSFGLDPARLLVVSARRQSDVLWALEDGLRSRALVAVIGQIDDVDLTPARRLALAAGETQTPCLLITHPRGSAVAATATRWRISPSATAPHPLDIASPGAQRFAVGLERCRSQPPRLAGQDFVLEWRDETFCFHMAGQFSDRASAPGKSARSGENLIRLTARA